MSSCFTIKLEVASFLLLPLYCLMLSPSFHLISAATSVTGGKSCVKYPTRMYLGMILQTGLGSLKLALPKYTLFYLFPLFKNADIIVFLSPCAKHKAQPYISRRRPVSRSASIPLLINILLTLTAL